MMAGTLVLCAVAARLLQVGQTAQPGGRDEARADRAAADAATWVGSVSPDQTFDVSPADRGWWVMEVCEGAAVVVDVIPVGTGVVEAVLLDRELGVLARAQPAASGVRISWISTFAGRVFVKVGPAPDSTAQRAQYRLQAWWVNALTCPVRATLPSGSPSIADAPAPPAVPLPPPTSGPPAAGGAQTAGPSGATWPPHPLSIVPSAAPSGRPATRELPPGVQEHDGFLWRLALGVGYTGWREHWDHYYGEGRSEWGNLVGGGLNMAFGGSLTESLYLYFDFNLNFPQVLGLGVGFGGYLEDNWFVDAAIGYQVPTCGYLAVTAGKEWWVGEQWLTGLSLRWMAGTGSLATKDWVTSVTLNWSLTNN
ncbi:MAG: hypothetical protein HY905_17645 [Deltaproteobacteria bacterium]|nr:hypothetical protein [Deltaproteobacteria bacterium]